MFSCGFILSIGVFSLPEDFVSVRLAFLTKLSVLRVVWKPLYENRKWFRLSRITMTTKIGRLREECGSISSALVEWFDTASRIRLFVRKLRCDGSII